MEDYEQLYYDLKFENKKLKKKIEELESDLSFIKKEDKKKLNIKKEIFKELENYKKNQEVKNNEKV